VTLLHDDAKEALLNCFRRKHGKPVYIGEASCTIGWGLKDTSGLFAELVVEGKIRPADIEERRRHDIAPNDAAFVLVR